MQTTIRNNKGFTLIEMAIVLVIIGIIIGAVVKGQDLIENAKAKQFVSKMKSWEISLNTYYDRKGRLPGDSDKNGIIGEATDNITIKTDIDDAKFTSAPEHTFQISGTSFYVFLGNDGGTPAKNYFVVCKDATCSATFDPANPNELLALKFFESYDSSTDGSANPAAGTVIGFKTAAGVDATYKATFSTPTAVTDWLDAAKDIKALGFQIK